MQTIKTEYAPRAWADLETGAPITEEEALDRLTRSALAIRGDRRSIPSKARHNLREVGTKLCPGCNRVKVVQSFTRRRGASDGLENRCASCRNHSRKERYYSDLERSRKRARTTSATHRRKPLVRLQNQLDKGYERAVRAGVPAERVTAGELLEYWKSKHINPLRSIYSGEELGETSTDPEPRSIDHLHPLSSPETTGHVLDNLVPCTHAENMSKQRRHFISVVGGIGKNT